MNQKNPHFSPREIGEDIENHLEKIGQEFRKGFEELRKFPKSVTIFGSSRANPGSRYYKEAEELSRRVATELKYAVVTGGGPGIMAAANLGAHETSGKSVGLTIQLPYEQKTNPYIDSEVHFNYFFARKAMLTFSAETYVFFPGGYGTFDEFFSILTLMQTSKIPHIPIILVGKEFWNNARDFMKNNMLEHDMIDRSDLDLFTIVSNIDQAFDIIKESPTSPWWKLMD